MALDAIRANMDATAAAVMAERATFLLAATMGKQKAGALVEKALLGYSPRFVDRPLDDLKRR
jgi:3-carboxy-cis,cis-muconate cycloisomerase